MRVSEKIKAIKSKIEQGLKDSETGFVHIRFQPEEIYDLCEALEVLLEYVSNSKCNTWIKFGNSESGYSQEHDDKERKKYQALTRVEEILK